MVFSTGGAFRGRPGSPKRREKYALERRPSAEGAPNRESCHGAASSGPARKFGYRIREESNPRGYAAPSYGEEVQILSRTKFSAIFANWSG
jgi:hypothetical protein